MLHGEEKQVVKKIISYNIISLVKINTLFYYIKVNHSIYIVFIKQASNFFKKKKNRQVT